MEKKSYTPFLVECLFLGGVLMAVTFLLLFGVWKVSGFADPSVMIWAFKIGFSGAAYLVGAPLIRCVADNMDVEPHHWTGLLFGLLLCGFTAIQLRIANEFGFSNLLLPMLAPPLGMLIALIKKKMGGEAKPTLEAV